MDNLNTLQLLVEIGVHDIFLGAEALQHLVNFHCVLLCHLSQFFLELSERVAGIGCKGCDLCVQIRYYVVELLLLPRMLLCLLCRQPPRLLELLFELLNSLLQLPDLRIPLC